MSLLFIDSRSIDNINLWIIFSDTALSIIIIIYNFDLYFHSSFNQNFFYVNLKVIFYQFHLMEVFQTSFNLVVFDWGLWDSKSLQVSRTHLII